MKNLKPIIAGLAIAFGLIALNSCDVTKVADVILQLTINFDPEFKNRAVPDSSITYKDLNDYPEYEDNKDKIDKTEILHFNYSIQEIRTENNMPLDSIIFKSVRFYMIPTEFDGKRIPGERYLLGEFENLQVSDYYKTAKHIISVSDEIGELITEQLKITPYFIFVTEYSELVGENADDRFDYIDAHLDMVLRVTVKE